MDEWDAHGPAMRIDRRATDWGLVSLAIGGFFLVMAPIQLFFNDFYWSIGIHHADQREIDIARVVGPLIGLAYLCLIGFGLFAGVRGFSYARSTHYPVAPPARRDPCLRTQHHPVDWTDHQSVRHPGHVPMSPRFRLSIPRSLFEAMLAHARAELPAECCGLLAGKVEAEVGRVTQHLPLVNALGSKTEYESEPRSMFAAYKAMRAAGTEMLAVYHSHPTSDPVPSRRDIERSYDETVVNLIIGMKGPEPDVRAWWIAASGAMQAEWGVS